MSELHRRLFRPHCHAERVALEEANQELIEAMYEASSLGGPTRRLLQAEQAVKWAELSYYSVLGPLDDDATKVWD